MTSRLRPSEHHIHPTSRPHALTSTLTRTLTAGGFFLEFMGTLLLVFVVFNVAVWAGKPLENDIAGSRSLSRVPSRCCSTRLLPGSACASAIAGSTVSALYLLWPYLLSQARPSPRWRHCP